MCHNKNYRKRGHGLEKEGPGRSWSGKGRGGHDVDRLLMYGILKKIKI